MSHSLFCQGSGNFDGFKRQCFNCSKSVFAQEVVQLKIQSLPNRDVDSKGQVMDKIFKNFESRYFVETRHCFQCGRRGHLARSCSSINPEQQVLKGLGGEHFVNGHKGYPPGLSERLH